MNPPTEHMRFPGTITVPDKTFEQVIESAARSFKLHGFRDVVFLGDHGGYQKVLRYVAAALNREWAATPVRAHAIVEYYRVTDTDLCRRAAEAGFHRRRNRHACRRRRHVADAGIDPRAGAQRSAGQRTQAHRQRRRVWRSSPVQRRSGTIGGGCHRRRDRGRHPAGHRAPLTYFHSIQFRHSPNTQLPSGTFVKQFNVVHARVGALPLVLLLATALSPLPAFSQAAAPTPPAVTTVPGMPPVPDPPTCTARPPRPS